MEKRVVKIRGTQIGAGLPKICVPLVAGDEEELQGALKGLAGVPYDLTEWRADFYRGAEEGQALERALELIRKEIGEKPLLFTFRTGEEGGNRSVALETYVRLNERAAESGLADIVDVEINRGEALAKRLTGALHDRGVTVLGSFHDFQGTPRTERMTGILCGMQRLGFDITKLAVMPKSGQDVVRLLEAAVRMKEELADRPCVTMSMGALGLVSRAAGSFSGSAITFGTAGTASAPGQIPAGALRDALQILSGRIEGK